MGTIDENGIYLYDDTDGAPVASLLNVGQQSVSNAIAALGTYKNVANTAARDTLSLAFNPSPTRPLYVHRRDAPSGFELECNKGAGFYSVSGGSRFRYVIPTASGNLSGSVDLAPAQTIPASPFGARPYWLRITGAAVLSCPAPRRGSVETLIDGSPWDYNELSGGSSSVQTGVRCNRPKLIEDYGVPHTAQVRVTSPDGVIIVLGLGRIFDIELTPATSLI